MSGTNYIASNWRIPENSNSSKNDNYSLDFNGSSDFVSCGDDPQIQLTGDISISAWFKTSSTGTMIIAAKRDSPLGGNTYGWQLYCSGGVVRFLVTRSGPTTTSITGTTTISDGAWHHVLCTINQDSQIAIILDGSTEGTASLPAGTFIDSGSDLRIGYNQIGSAHYYFNGEISEVALFDYLVSGATLYGDATSGAGNPMALKPTPVGYWPLGDNSASDPLAQPNVAVEDASVFDFNGASSESIVLSTSSSFQVQAQTVSIWVKPELNTRDPLFLNGHTSVGNVGFEVYQDFGNIRVRINGSSQMIGAVNIGEWNHIFAAYDGADLKYSVNGATIATTNFAATISYSFYTGLILGNSAYGYYDGETSNVAFWSSDQSSNYVNAYNNGSPQSTYTVTPTAWWKLDESANWEADTVGAWQIPDAVSEFPQSFDFDGTNDELNAGDILHNDGQTPMTVSAWVNVSTDGDYPIAGKKKVRSAPLYAMRGWDVTLDTSGLSKNKLTFQFVGVSSGGVLIGVITAKANGFSFNDGLWHHVVVTYDGSEDASGVKFYRDGVEDTNVQILSNTFSGNSVNDPSVDFKIGTRPKYSGSDFYNGELSNVQIWDVALTGEKVTTLYNGGTPTLTPPNQSDLKGWYKLDGNNKSIWNSSSAADTWLIEDANITPTYTEGLFFGGAYIGGSPVQNYAGLKLTNQTISASHISYSAWVKIIQPEVGNTTDIFNPINTNYLGTFTYRAAGKSMMWRGDGASKFIATSSTINSGAWHHIFCSYPNGSTIDHTQVKIYIDGSLQTNTYVGGTTSTGPVTNMLGILLGSVPKNMVISNWAFWLNDQSSNIATIYNNGTPSDLSTLNPEVWYKFNSANTTFNGVTGGEYGVATDSSGNNNSGKIAGKTDGTTTRLETSNVQAKTGASTGMTEQSLINNNVSTLNGESSGMTSGNLVLSDLTRNLPYENYSLQFDGTADYIDCGNISGLNGGLTEATWSGWFNRASSGTFYIMSTYGSGQIQFFVLQGNNYVTVYAGNSAGAQRTMSKANVTAWTTNQWYHFAFVYDESESSNADKMKIYIDGILQANAVAGSSLTSLNSSTADFNIGRLTGATTNEFNGKISNVAIWNNRLSSTEVQNLYTNGMPQDLTTFTPQPINWWTLGKESFWNGSNFITRDMIGSNDGTSANMGVDSLVGDAPRSEANGVGTNIAVPTDLKGEAGWSDKNGYSINMSSTARTTDTP